VRTINCVTPFMLVLLATAGAAVADEPAEVVWHTDLMTAWSTTCREGRPLLLFVTRDDCHFCTKMKAGTYADPAVADMINRGFVPLVLDGRAKLPLLAELKVNLYPSTFIISPQAVVLARYHGYVSPDELARRLAALRPAADVANMAQGR